MTKERVIREILGRIKKALDAKLTAEEYSEFLAGSVSFRLDLIRKPEKHFVTLDLPPRKEPREPNKLKVEFKRRYARRKGISVSPQRVN